MGNMRYWKRYDKRYKVRLHPEIDKTGGNMFFLADGVR